ncbi:PREDICTED: keratin, type I cytoskeletal 9-like [Priapulus caudatus]|uniref:Keratin, type I cytoskeletal 9-like n=1 Tax=Priapulus caudatus TaxID=37621 RepID=A0ABM1EXM2_PRICU|nr:PREDICTED: keratin, type I cytoskeletal 9-like [Priapulus caudatus]
MAMQAGQSCLSSASSKSKEIVVRVYISEDDIRKIRVIRPSSRELLYQILEARLGLTNISVQYYDRDLDGYVNVETLDDITDKCTLRVFQNSGRVVAPPPEQIIVPIAPVLHPGGGQRAAMGEAPGRAGGSGVSPPAKVQSRGGGERRSLGKDDGAAGGRGGGGDVVMGNGETRMQQQGQGFGGGGGLGGMRRSNQSADVWSSRQRGSNDQPGGRNGQSSSAMQSLNGQSSSGQNFSGQSGNQGYGRRSNNLNFGGQSGNQGYGGQSGNQGYGGRSGNQGYGGQSGSNRNFDGPSGSQMAAQNLPGVNLFRPQSLQWKQNLQAQSQPGMPRFSGQFVGFSLSRQNFGRYPRVPF